MESGFYYKKDLPQIPDYAQEITSEIVWVGKYVENFKFYTVPNWEKFLEFLGVRSFKISHQVYNRLGLSTQVPARLKFLVDKELPQIIYPRFFSTAEVAKDVSIFDNFSPLEYMFVEALARYDHITYDGYFKTQQGLIRGIFHRMIECKVKKRKVVTQAVLENPELLKILTKKQRAYCQETK